MTCPVETQKVLRAIAKDVQSQVAFWRVVKKNGELLSYFSGGRKGHATVLEKEGFTIDMNGKAPK